MTRSTSEQFIHLTDERELPRADLLSLQAAAFECPIPELLPANQRWLARRNDDLIGHLAIQRRWFAVNANYCEGWMLGGVCTRPAHQHQGVGTRMLERALADLRQQKLPFAELNCGASLCAFYAHVGFVKIAAQALYWRDGRMETDADPVLACALHQGYALSQLRCEAFPFLLDF